MSSAFGFRQGELERLFTTALEPNLNRFVFNVSLGRDRTFFKKKFGPKLPVQKMYETTLCPVQKISTSHKGTFFRLHDARQAGISRVYRVNVGPGTKKMQFLPTKRTF
jgi:hypothetical protein